ncbi:unnamed protein product [Cochlearia groenlandica]
MVSVFSMFLVLITIIFMNLNISRATSNVTLHEQYIMDHHHKWMIQYSRFYKNESEKEMRFEVYKKNLKYIDNFNKMDNQSYKLGVNEFTDLTDEEFRATHIGQRGINVTSQRQVIDKTIPSRNWNISLADDNENKDWRDEGVVTPIKRQGCGDCWAFTAISAVESLIKISRENLEPLSEQQLLDCSTKDRDGCNGGWANEAFEYIMNNKGISLESEYPYQQKKGTCRANASPAPGTQIHGFKEVPSNNELALLEVVKRQPVSVMIDTKSSSFKNYKEGVYNALDCGVVVDHSVTLVGYGKTENGLKYWLAKNSWGESWGEKGYLRIRRDVEWPQGMCGVAQFASYPVIFDIM